ncbi:MAG: class I SAM-dependent methyltransferase [Nanoarchaeota archaeon]
MEDQDISQAYDSIASEYNIIEADPSFKQLRVASFAALMQVFRQGKVVIDIGCSIGTEAIALAKYGVTVVGIDPSAEMVSIARKKARDSKLSNVYFYQLAAKDLSKLPQLCGFHRFDGAYSSLGALNHEPIIEPVRDVLMDLLEKGSPVVISVRNRNCALEMLAYVFTSPRKVFRRRAPFVSIPISGKPVNIRMYSNREVVRSMKPMKLVSFKALHWLVPPAHLSTKIPEDVLEFLSRMDEPLAGVWPLNRLGDYSIFTFVKR